MKRVLVSSALALAPNREDVGRMAERFMRTESHIERLLAVHVPLD